MSNNTKLSWPPTRDELIRLIAEGGTQASLGRLFGKSQATLWLFAKKHRVKWQARGAKKGIRKPGCLPWPPLRADLERFAAEGLSQVEIAKKYGVGATTIWRWMGRMGIKAAYEPVKRPIAPKPPAVEKSLSAGTIRMMKARDRVDGLLNLSPYRDITADEIRALKAKFPPLPMSERRRDWAHLHDPKRAVT